jgi:membrane protein DedA with SNARE-associated domain
MSSFIQHYGSWALFFRAAAESALVPIPSEVTFGFAGAYSTTAVAGAAHFSLVWVIVIGTVGSVVGSIVAYEVGRYLGRPIVDRYGKWILLTHHDLDVAERWFNRFGDISVLIGRFMPVVRTVISLPAGLAEMSRRHFFWMTLVGSAGWVALLAGLGYSAGGKWGKISHDVHVFQTPIIVIIVLLIAAFFWHRIRTIRRHGGSTSPDATSRPGTSRGKHSR